MQLPPQIFDDALIARRRARAAASLFLNAEFEQALLDRLDDVTLNFENALLLGYGAMSAALNNHPKIRNLTSAPSLLALPSPHSYDLVISAWELGFINDVPGHLFQIQQILKPDGWFLAVFYGGETLIELRQALWLAEEEILGGVSPRVAPMIDLRDAAALLQRANFALPVADHDTITVQYPDMFALMRELRAAGLNNGLTERRRNFTPKNYFMRAAQIYAEKFGLPDGRIPATVEIISLSAWAPAASQQKPLLPGSATQRLADALQATEHRV